MMIDTLARWRELVQSRDPKGLDALLADEVVFYSPVVHTPQKGKQNTQRYLAAAISVFANGSFRYVRDLTGDHEAALEFLVDIDGVTVNGIDLIRWDASGRIVEFKVMLRPLKAINTVHEKMAAMLRKSSGSIAG